MLNYNKTDLKEETDLTKSNDSKGCIVCHYWYFNHEFKLQSSVCNGCHDLKMLCLNLNNITFITVR